LRTCRGTAKSDALDPEPTAPHDRDCHPLEEHLRKDVLGFQQAMGGQTLIALSASTNPALAGRRYLW
jgi:hypothetical protein